MDLNVLNLSIESLLIIMIIMFVVQYYKINKFKEGVDGMKLRFASVDSEGFGSGLSGTDYNGGHLNYRSSHGAGKVITSTRDLMNSEGLATVTEGLNLIDEDAY